MNEELKDLKMVVTAGFTVSEQYSTRKIENRTSFEIPITVNPIIANAMEGILQIKAIHDANDIALESKMIDLDTFHFAMIPTFFRLQKITQEVNSITGELTEIDKYYLNYFKLCHEKASKMIEDYDLEEHANKLLV